MFARLRPGLLAACLMLAALTTAAAAGSAGSDSKDNKAELQALKTRIDGLRDELSKSESSRSDASDQLRTTETAISNATLRLRELAQARVSVQSALTAAQTEAGGLEQKIASQQSQLSALLKRHYIAGQGDSLNHMLGGDDPNQAARDAVYLQALSKAKARLVAGLKASLNRKAQLLTETNRRAEELAGIETDSLAEQTRLEQQRVAHGELLAKLADRIRQQRREIDSLKEDEQRMGRLVQGLARITQSQPPAPPIKRESVAPATPAAPSMVDAKSALVVPVEAKPKPETTVPADNSPIAEAGSFTKLKGRLTAPLRGELLHRFGSPKAEGASWKGVFIKAGAGEVRAAAAGRVVFADWLRGFGNLIIVDHGDEYLSVYGNNESLYRKVGETVAAGEAIAAVGNSGGNRETGLYFELRHQGQTVDPLKWLAPR